MEQHFANEQYEGNSQNNEIETKERQSTPAHQFTPYFSPVEPAQQKSEVALPEVKENTPAHQFTVQNNNQPSPYDGMTKTVQVPEYTVEQMMMQESIRKDEYGLLKIREAMKILCMSLLIALGMMLMFTSATLIQLTVFGFVSGGSVRFFSTTELFAIRVFYMVFIAIGSISFVNQIILLSKVGKIRTVSIPKLEAIVNGNILCTTLFTSATLFFAAFWLMTSQTSYWMYFIFQGSIIFITYLLIYLLIRKTDTILKRVKKHHIRQDNKPKAEIEYYKPIGYKTEVRYNDR